MSATKMDTATRVWVRSEASKQWLAAEITQQDTKGTGTCVCTTAAGEELTVASDATEMREVLPWCSRTMGSTT